MKSWKKFKKKTPNHVRFKLVPNLSTKFGILKEKNKKKEVWIKTPFPFYSKPLEVCEPPKPIEPNNIGGSLDEVPM